MTSTITRRPAGKQPPPPIGPARSAWNVLRRGWRRLTSMRTALVLLFLLAVASVPGSLLPQRPLNPSKVQTYLAEHGGWGRILDRLGFFDVFGTPWFAAIYLLLAISLVGCLIPRIRLHARGVRTRPLPAPKNLARLPESATFTVDGSADDAVVVLRRALGRRWRTVVRTDGPVQTISAEKGYLRETGNLIFHVALLLSLIAIASGRLWGYSASIVVTQGDGFCNTVSQYDSWRPGRFEQDGRVAPFCVHLNSFEAKYLATGEPNKFNADVTYTPYSGDRQLADRQDVIQVNHPLRLEGDRVYVIGHGYSPSVTVRRPDGRAVEQTAAFIPQDPNTFQSEGAFQFPNKIAADGTKVNDIGIQGFFSPTPVINAQGLYTSAGPEAVNPVLGVFVYQGDLGYTGLPKSVYSLDQGQITNGKLKKLEPTGGATANLRVGQTVTYPNGVTVTFNGYKQWVSFQVSHDPTQGYLLITASAMVVGLIGSLAVRRRRVWIRLVPVRPDPDEMGTQGPRTVVDVGGLARSDSGNFADEFAALAGRLRSASERPPDRED